MTTSISSGWRAGASTDGSPRSQPNNTTRSRKSLGSTSSHTKQTYFRTPSSRPNPSRTLSAHNTPSSPSGALERIGNNPWMGTDQEDGDIGFMPFERAANKEPLVDRLPELAHMPAAPSITPSSTIPDKREQRWSTIFVPLIPSTSTCDPPGSVEGPKDPWDIVAEISSSAPTKAVPTGATSTEDDLLAFFAGSTPASTSNTQREISIWDLPAAAEPDAILEENVDAEKMVLIRHILDLQKTLRLKVSRAENAHAAYAKQHAENLMLREYISNLKAATRKMEQETPEDIKKPAKPKRRGLFGYVPS